MPKIITYIQSHDDIFKGVKQESSLYARLKKDSKGEDLFDQLKFDEEYLILFRQYFFDASSKVISAVSAYLLDDFIQAFFASQNSNRNRDLMLKLAHPDTFKSQMSTPIANEMKEFIVSYIMYRWLETKAPQDAVTYLGRANVHLADMKRFLEMRIRPISIKGWGL